MDKNLETLKETAVQLRSREDGDRARLVLENCPDVLVRAVQFLKGLAKESKLPLPPFITAVIYSGWESLEELQSVAETVEFASSQKSAKDQPGEFKVWSAPKLAEALGSFRFYLLEKNMAKNSRLTSTAGVSGTAKF